MREWTDPRHTDLVGIMDGLTDAIPIRPPGTSRCRRCQGRRSIVMQWPRMVWLARCPGCNGQGWL